MTAENPIVAFLRARLDEDEQTARAASEESWTYEYGEFRCRDGEDWEHILRHPPSRLLRDIKAKREILDELFPEIESMDSAIECEWGSTSNAAEWLLTLLAAPYSDHEDHASAVGTVTT